MSKEVNGGLVNLYLRIAGAGAFRKAVCMTDSTTSLTTDVTTRKSNCGPKTAVSDPTFTISGNAIQNADPTSFEIDYSQLKTWVKQKALLDFNYLNDADVPNSVSAGEGVNHFGSGYITDLGTSASADDGTLTYSFTFTGSGNVDDYANSATS